MNRRAANRLLLAAFRRSGPWVGVMVVTSLLISGAGVVLPAVMGRTLDAVLGGQDAARWLALTAGLIFVLVVAETLDDFTSDVAEARATAWLRHTLLKHILAVGIRATRRFEPGDLVTRLVGNASETGQVAAGLIWVFMNLVPPLGAVVALALIDPWLCLTFLVGLPVLAPLIRAFIRDISDLTDRYLATQGTIAARLTDALTGSRTIAAARTVDREARRVLAPLPELHRHGVGMWRSMARMSAREALVVPLLMVAVLAVAGLELSHGRITPGDVLAASQYVVMATGLSSVVGTLNQLVQARSAAGRLSEVLAEPPVEYGSERLPEPLDGGGRLEFRGVTVRAGDDTALQGLDLTVPGGALVAVVGRSGSGKSLLAALAGRLVDPDEGEVLLDGVPLRRVDRGELRRAVGYGFERPALLGETFADAIGFGPRTPATEELVAHAKAARADAFIRHMPDGYGTRLADAPMSGGEVQRVGLARAFTQAERVLVLDDVAASLDTVTEHHISQVLTGALADRTRLIVTHRASTAARADLVVWLADGGVRARGRHRDLWADPGYRAAFQPDPAPGQEPVEGAAVAGGAR